MSRIPFSESVNVSCTGMFRSFSHAKGIRISFLNLLNEIGVSDYVFDNSINDEDDSSDDRGFSCDKVCGKDSNSTMIIMTNRWMVMLIAAIAIMIALKRKLSQIIITEKITKQTKK